MGRPRKQESAMRSRTWCVILYPDDLPDDWREQLQLLGIQAVISPLHDQDLKADGTLKKAHYHVILLFGSKKSASQLREMFGGMYGMTVPDEKGIRSLVGVANISNECIVHDRKAAMRYLCHLDNPEKAQYDPKDLIGLNGADVSALLVRSMQESQEVLQEILQFIEDNDIREFYQLALYAKAQPEWFLTITTKSTMFFNAYLKSRRHYRREHEGECPEE